MHYESEISGKCPRINIKQYNSWAKLAIGKTWKRHLKNRQTIAVYEYIYVYLLAKMIMLIYLFLFRAATVSYEMGKSHQDIQIISLNKTADVPEEIHFEIEFPHDTTQYKEVGNLCFCRRMLSTVDFTGLLFFTTFYIFKLTSE